MERHKWQFGKNISYTQPTVPLDIWFTFPSIDFLKSNDPMRAQFTHTGWAKGKEKWYLLPFIYILDGRLGLIFLPQILGGRSQILGRLRRLKRRDRFKSVQIHNDHHKGDIWVSMKLLLKVRKKKEIHRTV